MSTLLSAEQYAEIANSLTFPTQAFINGEYVPSISGQTFDTINPATGKILAKITSCTAEDVNIAVAHAKAAFEDGRWHTLPPEERKCRFTGTKCT